MSHLPEQQIQAILDENNTALCAHQNIGGKVKAFWSTVIEQEIDLCVDGSGNLIEQKWIDEQTAGRLLDNRY